MSQSAWHNLIAAKEACVVTLNKQQQMGTNNCRAALRNAGKIPSPHISQHTAAIHSVSPGQTRVSKTKQREIVTRYGMVGLILYHDIQRANRHQPLEVRYLTA